MNPKAKKGIILAVCIILIAGIGTALVLENRTSFNEEDVRGNTTGNLNNNGMFCEYDGIIYFSNPADTGTLYSMRPNCTDIKKLNTDSVSGINAAGSYIYYIRNNLSQNNASSIFKGLRYGVIRTNKDGSNPVTLYEELAGAISLYGNYIYYQRYSDEDALSFYRVKIDGSENTRISDNGYFPVSIYEDYLYYVNTTGNHNIYRYNLKTGQTSLYLEANAYMADMQGDYIYYIDLDDRYTLVRVNTSTMEKEILTDKSEGKCIRYNVYGDTVFYHLEGSNPALYRMNTDGSDNTWLFDGNITNISCTSIYTFFQLYDSDALYRVPTNGTAIVEQIVLK